MATGSAAATITLDQVPGAAAATATAPNPTVQIAIVVTPAAADATASAALTYLLQLQPGATVTAAAVARFLLAHVPGAADGTGTAVNPTVSQGTAVTPIASATGSADAGTLSLAIVPAAADGTITGAVTYLLQIVPGVVAVTSSVPNPTVNTTTVSAFAGQRPIYVIDFRNTETFDFRNTTELEP